MSGCLIVGRGQRADMFENAARHSKKEAANTRRITEVLKLYSINRERQHHFPDGKVCFYTLTEVDTIATDYA